ncbi:MAG: DNA-binding MarR family transcriptional regulator [Clostridium sp.]|jgi:DNA-binding MarR family transcriptional regulator
MKKDEVLKRLHSISEILTTVKPPTSKNENIQLGGLPHSARDILVQLYAKGEMNQLTLSKHVGCSPQAISKSVSILERKGLIIKNSISRKNQNNIILTQVGKEAAVQLKKIIEEHAEMVFNGFCDEDISAFSVFLKQIYENMNNGEGREIK